MDKLPKIPSIQYRALVGIHVRPARKRNGRHVEAAVRTRQWVCRGRRWRLCFESMGHRTILGTYSWRSVASQDNVERHRKRREGARRIGVRLLLLDV